ncbi:SGNH/GDSL hydrolase family protein [Kitasatospora sp. NPDC059811]|uniref:SGNH/GDSL hydrolase family protein n=1 Tax=Streptomycetaceae TaxID=2062 RepID=UPI0007AF625C|nr:SGNH/GDSL hydrolase family protein [Streptomyces sp. MJM8645]
MTYERRTSHDHETPSVGRGLRRGAAFCAAALAAVLALTSCGSSPAEDGGGPGPAKAGAEGLKKPSRILWMGDSIAVGQAQPLAAALKSTGIELTSIAADGGGAAVGPVAMSSGDVASRLASVRPELVAYQITTYDWGSPQEQQQAYEKLIGTVKAAGARLVIVTTPPFDTGDDFYAPHKADIESAPGAAKAAVAAHPGDAFFLDASALWGTDFKAPQAQRSNDRTHSCQQGTAKFAQWFTTEVGRLAGFSPADPKSWANGDWTKSDVFAQLNCA